MRKEKKIALRALEDNFVQKIIISLYMLKFRREAAKNILRLKSPRSGEKNPTYFEK